MIHHESYFKSEIFSFPIIKPKPDDLLFYTNCFIKLKPDNTTLQAAKLTAQENINITANNPPSPDGYGRTGNLLLTTAQNSSFKMESIRKNKTFAFKNNDNGFVNSEVLNNEITVGEAVGDRRQAVGEGDGSAFAQATDGQADSSINLTAQNTAYIEYKSGADSTRLCNKILCLPQKSLHPYSPNLSPKIWLI